MKSWKLMEDAITFSDKLKLAKFALTSNKFTNGEKVKEVEKRDFDIQKQLIYYIINLIK